MYPDILGTNTKKVEHEVTSKRKKYGHSSRPIGMKMLENASLIIIT